MTSIPNALVATVNTTSLAERISLGTRDLRTRIVHWMDAPSDVIGRAASLLRAVSITAPDATTAAVAREAGLPRPTAHRLLTALLEVGFVDRTRAGRWALGPELYVLGSSAARQYDVTDIAQPFVRQLALLTGESAFFSVRRGDETVCLLREDGSFPIRSHVLHEGIRLPLGVASAGLAILTYLSDEDVRDVLSRTDLVADYGPQHSADAVWERIQHTRRTGFALNPGLIVEGSWGLGAAVFDNEGSPRWALTLTGIEQRFDEGRRANMGKALLQAAHELTRALQPSRRHATA
jgi:DNA-binding IclR family transcriptional regulator